MAKINKVISAQNFELVRDRIATILYDEIDNQFQLSYDAFLDRVEVLVETKTPIDKVAIPTVNVSVLKGDYDNKNQGSVDGSYQYAIDVYTNAKKTAQQPGDFIANMRLQKLLGLCRYILEDPFYNRLGYQPGFVMRTMVSDFNIAAGGGDDTNNTAMGRIIFSVMLNENNSLKTPELIDSYQTQVKIENTNKGYFWEGYGYN
jgi:hypothetical protein